MAVMRTTLEYKILTFFTNHEEKLSPHNLIGLYQDAASKQSQFLGVGFQYMVSHDLIWVLIKYNIHVTRYPKYGEKIRIVTFPMYHEKFYVYRKFEMYDSCNNLISYAYSAWTIVNKKSKQLMKITDDLIKAYAFKNKYHVIEKAVFEKLSCNSEFTRKTSFKIRYDDIDRNNHVTNTKYLSWAIESCPYDTVINNHLSNIHILYRKEILYGDTININTAHTDSQNNEHYYHEVLNSNNELLCQIKTTWEKTARILSYHGG